MTLLRVTLVMCLMVGGAQAEIKTVADIEAEAVSCDTCQARQNGKRALREYLAQKRAEEGSDGQKDDTSDD
ncbi:MAG: hypothetical protein AAF382_11130 [Pseudomonadota bacterium]